jgi:hypothetical protein
MDHLTQYNVSESGTTSSSNCNGQFSNYYDATKCGGGGASSYHNGMNGRIVIELLSLSRSSFKPTSQPTSYSPSVLPSNIPSHLPSTPTSYGILQPLNVFEFRGQEVQMTIPEHISQIYVYVWGGGGGYGWDSIYSYGPGGAGSYIEGILNVIAGETLNILVGGFGKYLCILCFFWE